MTAVVPCQSKDGGQTGEEYGDGQTICDSDRNVRGREKFRA